MSRVNIASLNINIVASSTGLQSQVNQAVNAIRSLNTGIQQQNQGLAKSFADIDKIILRSVAIYGIFRAANFGKEQLFDSVRLAADAETAAISFEVLLGSAKDAAEIIEGLYTFVDETPFFSLEESRTAAKSLSAYGFENEKILPTLRALADVSASTGNSLFDLAEVYGRTRVEQRLYTRDLNQFTSRGIPLISIFAKQFGVAETEIRKMAEAGQLSFDDVERAFASMTSEGGAFFGFLDRLSQTAAGQFSELQDKINRLKTEFGTGLIPALNDAVIAIKELITQGDEGVSTMQGFNDAGKLLAETLRVVAASVQFLRAGFIKLEAEVFRAVGTVGILIDAISGTQINEFGKLSAKILQDQGDNLVRSASRLMDANARIQDTTASLSRSNAKSLADAIGAVPDEIQRARNQFRLLKEDSEKFAEALKKNLLTPLEKFEQEVRLLVQSNILGFLDDTSFGRALAAEVERLNSATQRLKATLNDGSSFERNSVAAEELIAKTRNTGGVAGGAGDPAQLIAKIREQVAAEIELMKKQTEEVAANTEAVKELTEELKKQPAVVPKPDTSRDIILDDPKNPANTGPLVAKSIGERFTEWLRSFGPSKSDRKKINEFLGGARGAVREINVRNSPLRQPRNVGDPSPGSPRLSGDALGKIEADSKAAQAEFAAAAEAAKEAAEVQREINARALAEQDDALRTANGYGERLASPEERFNKVDEQNAEARESFNATFDDFNETLRNMAEESRRITGASQAGAGDTQEQDAADKILTAAELFEQQVQQLVDSVGITFGVDGNILNDLKEGLRAMRDQRSEAKAAGEKPPPLQPGIFKEAAGRLGVDSEKLSSTINSNSAQERAKLDRIATAVEKFANQPPIQVQTFVA